MTRRSWQACRGSVGRWDFELDLSNCSRPYLVRWMADETHAGLSLQWGNRHSDPVWRLDLPPLRLPGWLLDRWER